MICLLRHAAPCHENEYKGKKVGARKAIQKCVRRAVLEGAAILKSEGGGERRSKIERSESSLKDDYTGVFPNQQQWHA